MTIWLPFQKLIAPPPAKGSVKFLSKILSKCCIIYSKFIFDLPCEGAAGLLLFMETLDRLLVGEAVSERSGDETEAVVAVDEVEFIFLTCKKRHVN